MQRQLTEIYELLQSWKAERRLSVESQHAGLLGNLCEELAEYFRAQNDNERVDALCDIIVFAINAMSERPVKWHPPVLLHSSSHDIIFGVGGLAIFIEDNELVALATRAYLLIGRRGYDPYRCMLETIKEISSRTGKYDESIGKWVKDKSPEAVAKWYKADYERCKNDD